MGERREDPSTDQLALDLHRKRNPLDLMEDDVGVNDEIMTACSCQFCMLGEACRREDRSKPRKPWA